MSKKDVRKIPVNWKEKFFEVKIIDPEPPFNREGYWKKHKQDDLEIKEKKFDK